MTAVSRAKVTKAVVDVLRDQLPEKVGYGQRPSGIDGDQVYHIVYNTTVGQTAYKGSPWTQKESMEKVRFLIVTVGSNVEQTEDRNDVAAAVIIDRDDSDHTWVNPIPIADHSVMSREKMGSIPTSGTTPPQAGTYVELFVTIT